MKSVILKERPDFALMKLSDVISFYHLQMPRWLFSDGVYKKISLEAKVTYTFLLNRFQLSRINGWINTDGEVFVIFTREELAREMQVSYKKAIDCFKELADAHLIWERRPGRGHANQIYLASVKLTPNDVEKHTGAPFTVNDLRCAENECLDFDNLDIDNSKSENQISQDKNKICQNGTSKNAVNAYQDVSKVHPSKKDRDKFIEDKSDTNGAELDEILNNCELHLFSADTQNVFSLAVERLYFSENFKLGTCVLPNKIIRRTLLKLNGRILQQAEQKLRRNMGNVKNSAAYIMAVVFNEILESDADLLLDPYLNSLLQGGGIT